MIKSLGGKTFKELGLTLLKDSKIPILPNTREHYLSIPGRNGSLYFGAELEPRIFNLECAFFNSEDKYELQKRVRTLASHLVDGYGKPKEIDLIFDYEPDKVYKAVFAGSLPINRIMTIGTFTLPLVAYDPFAYLIEDTTSINLDSEITLDYDLRLDDQYTYTITIPTNVEINNFGTVNISPITEIIGSFSTLSLKLGDKVFYFGEAISNETLIIDHEKYTAKIGTFNKLKAVSGDFVDLPAGISEVEIGGTDLDFTINFRFKPRFI